MSEIPVEELPERPEAAPGAPPPESVGAILARARAELGISLEDVAHQLKYSARQIDALEQDRFDRLHGSTFARGMVRSYARLLRLDAEPLLERLGDKVAKPAPIQSSVTFRRPIPFSNSSRRSTLAYVFLTIAILAVGATVAIEWHQERVPGASGPGPTSRPIVPPRASTPPPAPKVAAPAASASGPAPGAASATGAAAPAATPAATAGSATPAAPAATATPAPTAAPAPSAAAPAAVAAPAASATAGASPPPAAPAPTATPAASAGAASGTAPPAAGQHRIVLVFDQQSWVEIKGADGKKLLEKLNPAGTRQVVDGTPPFSLVIGNAAHVHVTYDGHPVDLKPHTKVEVARFSLD